MSGLTDDGEYARDKLAKRITTLKLLAERIGNAGKKTIELAFLKTQVRV